MTKEFAPVLDVNQIDEDIKLGPKDKKVIDAFTSGKPAESKKLRSDGKKLDGLWMGGNEIASWSGGKITFNDIGSRSGDVVQRAIRKNAAPNDLNENRKLQYGEKVIKFGDLSNGDKFYIVDRKTVLDGNGPSTKVGPASQKSGSGEKWGIGKNETVIQVNEGTTSGALAYEKHKAQTTPAPKLPTQGPDDVDEPNIDDMDREGSDGVKTRREATSIDNIEKPDDEGKDPDNGVAEADIKDEDKVIPPEDAEEILDEANFSFKEKQPVTYGNKPWLVKNVTRDFVELVDKRGFTKIVDFDEIKSFKSGKIVTEQDEQRLSDEIYRMNLAAKSQE